MKKLNIKNLIFLSVLVFGLLSLITPKISFAYPGFYMLSGSYDKPTSTITRDNPAPIIQRINPNQLNQNSEITEIVITGNNFIPTSIAKLNGEDRATIYINSNKLIMELNKEDTSKIGKNVVTVYNQEPGGGFSNGVLLTVTKQTTTTGTTKNNQTNIKNTSSKNITVETNPATPVIESNIINNNNEEDTTILGSNTTRNNLTANASRGTFFPNTIFSWIILTILILLAILLWRRIWVQDKKRNPTQLKDA